MSNLSADLPRERTVSRKPGTRWWAVALVALVGFAFCFGGYLFVAMSGKPGPSPQVQFVADACLSVGVAFLLSGTLFLLEASFVKRIGFEARKAEARVDKVVADTVEEKVDRKIREVQADYEKRIQDEDTRRAEGIAALSDQMEYDDLSKLLTESRNVRGIDPGGLVVSCAFTNGVRVRLRVKSESIWGGGIIDVNLVEDKQSSIEWSSDEPLVDVLTRIRSAQLAAGGVVANQNVVPVEFASNVSKAFDLASKSRLWQPTRGSLRELLPNGYAIFDSGVVTVSDEKVWIGPEFVREHAFDELLSANAVPGMAADTALALVRLATAHFPGDRPDETPF